MLRTNQILVLRETVAQIEDTVNIIDPAKQLMSLILIESDKLTNIHFEEYPEKENNIPKME